MAGRSEAVRYLALPRSLPSPEEFNLLVSKYKSFRLLSLQLSPECFGSTHAREAAFPDETWVSRITNAGATSVVAVSDPAPSSTGLGDFPDATCRHDTERILSLEWLASLTLVGPLEPQTALDMYKGQMHLDPSFVDFSTLGSGEARWHFVLNAMYVVPSARGRGIGRGILEFAKKVAKEAGKGDPVRVLLIVDYDNEAARVAYEKSGFAIVHRYWFDDTRVGRGARTEAAVMQLDL